MGILIKNGAVLQGGGWRQTDLLCENEKIVKIAEGIPAAGHTVIDAAGLHVAPGLVDLHVHLRDPGLTYKEDIATGTAAAAAGGFTAVACMPNTKPVCDSPEVVAYIRARAAEAGSAHVLPIGAVTVGERGAEMTDFAALKAAGVVAFSDDGVPVMDDAVEEQAQLAADKLGMLVLSHCEDADMVKNYACNQGKISDLLGLPGRPAEAEDKMVRRDIALARKNGTAVHICHVSTRGAVELIRRGKADGVRVTAETCPQYFLFTEELLPEKGTMARINPPLRTEADRAAVLQGVLDGTLDCIVTDHAPHSAEEKARPLADAPSGMVGLETSLAACITALVKPGHMTLAALMEKMSAAPSRLIGWNGGVLTEGGPADVVIFDPAETWIVKPEQFRSKGRNTAFAGMELTGRVKATVCGGKITFQAPGFML